MVSEQLPPSWDLSDEDKVTQNLAERAVKTGGLFLAVSKWLGIYVPDKDAQVCAPSSIPCWGRMTLLSASQWKKPELKPWDQSPDWYLAQPSVSLSYRSRSEIYVRDRSTSIQVACASLGTPWFTAAGHKYFSHCSWSLRSLGAVVNIQSQPESPAPPVQRHVLNWKLEKCAGLREEGRCYCSHCCLHLQMPATAKWGGAVLPSFFITRFWGLQFTVIQNEAAVLWGKVSVLRCQHTSKAAAAGLSMSWWWVTPGCESETRNLTPMQVSYMNCGRKKLVF